MITVYTRPACGPCVATKRHLDRLGLLYRVVDVAQDTAVTATLRARGFQASPVVIAVVDGAERSWSGYRPDELDRLAHDLQETAA